MLGHHGRLSTSLTTLPEPMPESLLPVHAAPARERFMSSKYKIVMCCSKSRRDFRSTRSGKNWITFRHKNHYFLYSCSLVLPFSKRNSRSRRI
jgi:hypothetical protein